MVECNRALRCPGGRLDGGGLGHQAPTKPFSRHDPGDLAPHPNDKVPEIFSGMDYFR